MSRRFLYFALAGLVVGAMLVGLPYGLTRVAESRLRARLDAGRVDLQWEDLSWSWPAGVELSGVSLQPGKKGPAGVQLSGTIARVQVDLTLDALFERRAHLGDIWVQGASLTVDLEAPGEAPRSPGDLAGASKGPNRSADAGKSEALEKFWSGLKRAGAVRGEDIDVRLLRAGEGVATLHIVEATLAGVDAQRRALTGRGSVALQSPKLAAILAFSSAPEAGDSTRKMADIDWLMEGHLVPHERSANLQVGAPDAERALVALDLGQLGALSLGRLVAAVHASGRVELGAEHLRAHLGDIAMPAVEMTVAKIGVSMAAPVAQRAGLAAPAALTLSRPHLTVAPGQLAKFRGTLNELRALIAPVSATEGLPTPAAPDDDDSASWRARLERWLHRGNVRVEAGQLVLRLADQGGEAREIALVEAFDARLENGALSAQGKSAGSVPTPGAPGGAESRPGRVAVSAEFLPGALLPRTLSVEAENIRLDDLPGIQEGRTLPKRGIRGRVGGTIGARVHLWTRGAPLLRPASDAQVNVAGDFTWREGRVEVSGLAAEPLVGIDMGVDFSARWNPAMALVELSEARLNYGPLTGHLRGTWVDYALDPVIDVEARVDKIACQDAVRALPDALLAGYRQIEIEGEAAPKFSFYLPIYQPRKLRIHLEDFVDQCHVIALNAQKDVWPALSFAKPGAPKSARAKATPPPAAAEAPSLWERMGMLGQAPAPEAPEPAWPAPPHVARETYELPDPPEGYQPTRHDDVHWLNRPFIKQVTEGVSEDAEVFVGPGTEDYVALADLPAFVGGASYLSEEMGFYTDHAIALGLVQRALRIDFERGRFVYGGSTITQQLVKNLFLTRDKMLSRKLSEALIAWRIDDAVPKWRVLELYLNCIEYAQDIYGIGPAARYYFGKEAQDLTPKEAVFIAILKPAPWYGDRFRRRGQSPARHWWFDRMGEIMGRLVDRGYLSAEQAEAEKPYILYWDEEGNYLPDGPSTDGF